MTALLELENEIQRVAEGPGLAIVGLGRGWAGGSGIVIGSGRILTTAHNLRSGRHRPEEIDLIFLSGERASGRVAGVDPDLDVAVIEAETGSAPAFEWAEQQPQLGRAVLALANPGGRGLHVTPGTVSSTTRSFRGPRGRRIHGALEHTAPLPRGSSGGPLVDLDGKLIGINAVRVDGGLILAIPADAALRERVDAVAHGEAPARVHLGVAVAPPRVARRLQSALGLPPRDGILVRAVEPDSAAARAGIELGDLMVSAAGQPLERLDALYTALDGVQAGGQLELTVVRALQELTVPIKF